MRQRLVLRRHGARDLAANPRIAATEFALFQALHGLGLPVATPRALDESIDLLPTPYLLLNYLPGETLWQPADPVGAAHEIARQMAAIHAIPAGVPDLPALPDRLQASLHILSHPPETLDDSLSEGAIRAALTTAGPSPNRNTHVLLHNDLWPGNILWQDGAVTGILDWSEAAVGDPIADLVNSRLELLWAYGEAAMEALTATYLDMTSHDTSSLPWWDLIAALKPCGLLSFWINDPIREAPPSASSTAGSLSGPWKRWQMSNSSATGREHSGPHRAPSLPRTAPLPRMDEGGGRNRKLRGVRARLSRARSPQPSWTLSFQRSHVGPSTFDPQPFLTLLPFRLYFNRC